MSGADGPLVVVANERAGGIEGLEAAVAVLRARAKTTVVEVAEPGELEAALTGLTGGTVVAAGGDGTLNMLVQHLWERDRLHQVVLGLLPLGTGNDLVRTVGIGGLVATRAAPLKPLLGRMAYAAGAAWTGARTPGWDVRVEVDGGVLAEGTVLFVGIGNGATIGGGTVLWPLACPDDGLAEVTVASPAARGLASGWLGRCDPATPGGSTAW